MLHKRENGFTMSTHNITSLDGSSYDGSTYQFHKICFHISKCLACNAEKLLQLKITKKRMNITTFINIYTNIDTYIICDKNDSK